jgi:hypothetical protein
VCLNSRVGPGLVPGDPSPVPMEFLASLNRVRRFENKMLKVRKWFTVFKTINYFSKIKKEF